jgi:hypothetical protein
MCFVFPGMGLLIGNPIDGSLLDLERGILGRLNPLVLFIVGTALLLVLQVLKWKGDGRSDKVLVTMK